MPTFTIGVLSYPPLKKEMETLCQSLERGLQHEVQVAGPSTSLRAGPACLARLPGPSGFCRRPHLDHRWRKIRVWTWKLSVRPQHILEADSSYPARWTQAHAAADSGRAEQTCF